VLTSSFKVSIQLKVLRVVESTFQISALKRMNHICNKQNMLQIGGARLHKTNAVVI
jgi:hypothetical protein